MIFLAEQCATDGIGWPEAVVYIVMAIAGAFMVWVMSR